METLAEYATDQYQKRRAREEAARKAREEEQRQQREEEAAKAMEAACSRSPERLIRHEHREPQALRLAARGPHLRS